MAGTRVSCDRGRCQCNTGTGEWEWESEIWGLYTGYRWLMVVNGEV